MKKTTIFLIVCAIYFASEFRIISGEERFLEQLKIILSQPAIDLPKKEPKNKMLQAEKTYDLLQNEVGSSQNENRSKNIRTEFAQAGATVESWAEQYVSKNREENHSRFEHYVKHLQLLPEDIPENKSIRQGEDAQAKRLCDTAINKYLSSESTDENGPQVGGDQKVVVVSKIFKDPQSPWYHYRCKLHFTYHKTKKEFFSVYFGKVEGSGISGYLIRLNDAADTDPSNFVDFVNLKYESGMEDVSLSFPGLDKGTGENKEEKMTRVKVKG